MRWPKKDAVAESVVSMLRVNMGLQAGERLLVVVDLPRVLDWQSQRASRLEDMVARAMLARVVSEAAAEGFPDCSVSFLPYFSTGSHGTEPDVDLSERLREVDVAIALTTYSLSHTDARERATEAGVRIASMPGFETRMLEAGGPLAVDHKKMAGDCRRIAERLNATEQVRVLTDYGTDLTFSIAGRPGQVDDGLYASEPGLWGNLPAGETYAIPVEGTGQGRLVVPAGWYPDLEEELRFDFDEGLVVALTGGGRVGDELRSQLKLSSEEPTFRRRRNLAELGIGTNPNAKRPDNVLEAEKIKGTIHLAIGDNLHMGGVIEADMHEDFVQPAPNLLLDGETVIESGEWRW